MFATDMYGQPMQPMQPMQVPPPPSNQTTRIRISETGYGYCVGPYGRQGRRGVGSTRTRIRTRSSRGVFATDMYGQPMQPMVHSNPETLQPGDCLIV